MLKKLIATILSMMLFSTSSSLNGLKTCLSMVSSMFVSSAFAEDDDFVIDENGVLIEYNGSEATVIIDNDTIVSIGSSAFYGNTNVIKIVVASDIETIESNAFCDCASLTEISLPDTLISISDYAFQGCTSLETITLPIGVTTIGYRVFENCERLARIGLPDNVTEINSSFEMCAARVYCTIGSVTSKTLSDNGIDFYIGEDTIFGLGYENVNGEDVLIISEYNGDENITEITVPHYADRLGRAFTGDSYLKKITLSDGITSMSDDAFSDCNSLETVILPDTITTISEDAFYNCTSLKTVILPDTITTISKYAFCNCTSLKTVILPDTLISISDYAFQGCTSLETITLPAGVTTIGYQVFRNCNNLKRIELPDNVTEINRYSFEMCAARVYCTIGSVTSKTLSDNGIDFYIGEDTIFGLGYENVNGEDVLIISEYNGDENITEITVPHYADRLGRAFTGDSYLKKITLSDGITSMSDDAFSDCNSLETVILPDTITTISEDAFYNCTSLKTVILPDTITTISKYAFCNCTSLKTVILPDTLISISDYAFQGCTSLETITLPAGVTTIGYQVFRNCNNLKRIELPDNVTEINRYSFEMCAARVYCTIGSVTSKTLSDNGIDFYIGEDTIFGLGYENVNGEDVLIISEYNGDENITEITVPHYADRLGRAFTGDSYLKKITLSDGITSMSDDAFSDCNSLETVILPDTITTISEDAFYNCTSLKTVILPDTLISISDYAFQGCTSLETITLPAGVTTIGYQVFRNCNNLKRIELPDNVTEINRYSFEMCAARVYCTIGSVTSKTLSDNGIDFYIGEDTIFGLGYENVNGEDVLIISEYNGDENITEITVPHYADRLGRAFTGDSYLKKITLSDGITSMSDDAFSDCNSLETVILPDTITTISEDAFYNCTSLKTVILPDTITTISKYAFCNCTSLKTVILPDTLISISDYAFQGCTSLETITLPAGVTTIGYQVFRNCNNLKRIELPDNVTEINRYSFEMCAARVYCTIGSVTSKTLSDNGIDFYIGEDTIFGLGYENVNGEDVLIISEYNGDENITEITVPHYADRLGRAFTGDSYLKKITLSDGITSMSDDAFSDCNSLETVILPDTITTISEDAFYNCTSLKTVILPDTITTISKYAFCNCTSLKTVILPDTLISISDYAFQGCTSLETITLPAGVTTIGYQVFRNCNNLKRIELPDNVTEINRYSFEMCAARVYCTIGSVTSKTLSDNGIDFYIGEDTTFGLGYETVDGKELLSLETYTGNENTIKIPDYIEHINDYAFWGNPNIKELILPESIVTISSIVFDPLRQSLTRIVLPDAVSEIPSGIFYGFERLTEISIPEGVTSIASNAIINCSQLITLELPKTISYIDDDNFRNCPLLKLTVYPDSYAEKWADVNAIPYVYNSQKALTVTIPEEKMNIYGGLLLVLSDNETETVKVIDKSVKYVFYGVTEDKQYHLAIKNSFGHLLSDRKPVTIQEIKTEVQIPTIYDIANIHLTIRDENSNNVSSSARITWKDEAGKDFASGLHLANIVSGTIITAEVSIVGQVALEYAQPEPMKVTVSKNSEEITLYLEKNENEDDAIIALTGTYTAASKTVADFDSWDQVKIQVSDVSSGVTDLAYVLKEDGIHLGSQVKLGDLVRIRIEAFDNDFFTVDTTAVISKNNTTTISLIQKGTVSANYHLDAPVTLLIYDSNGKLCWTANSDSGTITSSGLDAGLYTVVLMSAEICLNLPRSISDISLMGLIESEDYLSETITIYDNSISIVNFGNVPISNNKCEYFDSKLFSINSRMPKVGNYFTLKASAGLKQNFSETATDLYWAIQIPEKCALAGETLTVANIFSDYTKKEDGTIVIPVDDATQMLRVCLLPLAGGKYEINGSFNFTTNGEHISVPMPGILYFSEGLTINVPEKTNSIVNNASGKISGTATVILYDNGVEVAQTETDYLGSWNVDFELLNPYTYSSHVISAVFETTSGKIESEEAVLQYQYVEKPTKVDLVKLIYGNSTLDIPMSNVHLGDGTAMSEGFIQSFSYVPGNEEIIFEAMLEGDDLSTIKKVYFQINLSNGKTLKLTGTKVDNSKWRCVHNYTSNALPSGVSVFFSADEEITVSSEQIENWIDESESGDEQDDELVYLITTNFVFSQEELDADERLKKDFGRYNERKKGINKANNSIDEFKTAQSNYHNTVKQVAEDIGRATGVTSNGVNSASIPGVGDIKLSNKTPSEAISSGYEQVKSTGDATAYLKTNKDEPFGNIDLMVALDDGNSVEIACRPGNIDLNGTQDFSFDAWKSFKNLADLDKYVEFTSLTIDNILRNELTESQAFLSELEQGKLYEEALANRLEDELIVNPGDTRKQIALDRAKKAQRFYTESMKETGENIGKIRENLLRPKGALKHVKIGSKVLSAASVTVCAVEVVQLKEQLATINKLLEKYPDDQDLQHAKEFAYWLISYKVGATAVGLVSFTANPLLGLGIGIGASIGDNLLSEKFEKEYDALIENYEEDIDDNNELAGQYETVGKSFIQGIVDPSGYVYEAVLSNRLEGVEATVWQKETKYDIYGDPYEEITQWNAGMYDQINPQITGKDGIFAWDVPDGLWQVRLWKYGYEEVHSEWLEVPPPQTNVNLAMVNKSAPIVKHVSTFGDCTIIEFDRYIDTASVMDNIMLSGDGQTIHFTLSFPDAESAPEDESKVLARKVLLTYATPLSAGTILQLNISNNVCSYAGIEMGEDYEYEGKVDGIESLIVEATDMKIGEKAFIRIIVEPAEIAQGMSVIVSGDLDALNVKTSSLQLNSFGRASLEVQGENSGLFNLHFALKDTELTSDVVITVSSKQFIFQDNTVNLAADLPFADEYFLKLSGEISDYTDLLWQSSNEGVAKVENGLVKAIAAGDTVITASMGNVSSKCNVHVYGSLEGLSLPSTLNQIDEEAFRDSGNFQYVVIPNGVISLGDYAFADNEALLFAYVPNTVQNLGQGVFENSNNVVVCIEGVNEAIKNYCDDHGVECKVYK